MDKKERDPTSDSMEVPSGHPESPLKLLSDATPDGR